ncbi:C-X-C motif chemokine 9-like [Mugil cephalus]|uniref:C-X-C motif chemokine 9-like n=1 Tax=Mugil cephalus TaxID=48193 RepID=UPI001FB648E0|nr:C-X-C motif chemokine 9-like [Mugil cephalus]XP_047448520.1 C-X-C motif chemokine 9-like [Mugil cephalus]
MNSAVTIFLTCLLVFWAQGQPAIRSSQCKCSKSFVGRMSQKLIRAEPVVHYPSIFCPRTEIIITTAENKEKCVNPLSPLGQLILKNKSKHEKKGAGSTTTASGHTTTSSSTRLYTTSKM